MLLQGHAFKNSSDKFSELLLLLLLILELVVNVLSLRLRFFNFLCQSHLLFIFLWKIFYVLSETLVLFNNSYFMLSRTLCLVVDFRYQLISHNPMRHRLIFKESFNHDSEERNLISTIDFYFINIHILLFNEFSHFLKHFLMLIDLSFVFHCQLL